MPPIIEIKNLKKRYATRSKDSSVAQYAVKDLSLTIERGEVFSLLGPNGAGKTTTISMMCGLLSPTEGDVIIDGFSIVKDPIEAKRRLGVVPQEIALYPSLSARANLEFFGKMYNIRGAELTKRTDEVLDFIDLRDRQNDAVETFSGGMKRRVNIGVGLLHKPSVVFMDEPTVGVDPQSRRRILDTVKLLNEQGMTVLYTTHYMEEAEELSKRVGIMDQGQLIACGTEGELIQQVGEKDLIRLRFDSEVDRAIDILKKVPEVDNVSLEEEPVEAGADKPQTPVVLPANHGGRVRVMTARGRQAVPQILKHLDDAGLIPFSIEIVEPNLESVFLHLTGRALRD